GGREQMSFQGRQRNDITNTIAGIANSADPQVIQNYSRLPLSFEANEGQTDPQVEFLSRGSRHTLFLTTSGEAVLRLTRGGQETILRMRLIGASPNPKIAAIEERPGKINYFLGNDPKHWRTSISTYCKVAYHDIYPGVDLVYYGSQRELEYDFVVAPGGDPNDILLDFEGAEPLKVDASSADLLIHSGQEEIRHRKPVIYQEVDGIRQEVAGTYIVRDDRRVGFQVGSYDTTRPLVIDPTLVYSTYIGGSSTDQSQ